MFYASSIFVGVLCGLVVPWIPNKTWSSKAIICGLCVAIMEISYWAGKTYG